MVTTLKYGPIPDTPRREEIFPMQEQQLVAVDNECDLPAENILSELLADDSSIHFITPVFVP